MRKFMILVAAFAVTALTACSKPETVKSAEPNPDEVTKTTSEQEKPGMSAPGDLSPAEAQARVDDVTIGHELGADGAMVAGRTGDDFAPGEPVHIAMQVGDSPAGSAIKVAWFAPGETRIGDETKTVANGAKYLNFTSGDTKAWALGDYRAEIWIGDEKVNVQQFQIVEPAKAGI